MKLSCAIPWSARLWEEKNIFPILCTLGLDSILTRQNKKDVLKTVLKYDYLCHKNQYIIKNGICSELDMVCCINVSGAKQGFKWWWNTALVYFYWLAVSQGTLNLILLLNGILHPKKQTACLILTRWRCLFVEFHSGFIWFWIMKKYTFTGCENVTWFVTNVLFGLRLNNV